MHLTVRVMPPLRPTNSLLARLTQQRPVDKIESITIPAEPTDTFEQIWKLAEQRYVSAYSESHHRDSYFSRLQTQLGADIVMADAVGTIFTESTPQKDMVLLVQRNALDRDCSMPQGTILRPKDFRKRTMDPEQERATKRLKIQQERYGAPVDALDPDTAVNSREVQEGVGGAPNVEQRRDAEGFAIPTKPTKPYKRSRHRRTAPPPGRANELVLVPDSQARAQSLQQQRTIGSDTTTAPSESRPSRTSPKRRETSAVPRAVSHHSDIDRSAPQIPGPPTPDSNSRLQSNEPPESAQRPKATARALSERPVQNDADDLPTLSNADAALAVADPIQDDGDDDAALLNSFGAGEFDDDLISLQGVEGEDNGHTIPQNEHRTALRHERSQPTPFKINDSSQSIVNAFEILRSSQNAPLDSASKAWTPEEDRALLKGIRSKWSMSRILRRFNLGRSDSAARGRKQILLKRYPDMRMPGPSDDETQVSEEISSREHRDWEHEELRRLAKGYHAGLTNREIWSKSFPDRSEESVLHKVRDVELKMIKHVNIPDDGLEIPGWTVRHGLKLRRAFDTGMSADEAQESFFRGFTIHEIQRKLTAYRQNASKGPPSSGAYFRSSQLSQSSTAGGENGEQHPATDQSPCETRNAGAAARRLATQRIGSSPPEALRRRSLVTGTPGQPEHHNVTEQSLDALEARELQSLLPETSSEDGGTVIVEQTEQQIAQDSLSKTKSSEGQTLLNFRREKGKGVDRPPRESTAELDRRYKRSSSSRSASHQQPARTPLPADAVIPSSTQEDSGSEVAEYNDSGRVLPAEPEGEDHNAPELERNLTIPDQNGEVNVVNNNELVDDQADKWRSQDPDTERHLDKTLYTPSSDASELSRPGTLPRSSRTMTYSSQVRRIRRREIDARAAARAARAIEAQSTHTHPPPDPPADEHSANHHESRTHQTIANPVDSEPPNSDITARRIVIEGESSSDDEASSKSQKSTKQRKGAYDKTDQEIWDEAAAQVNDQADIQRRFERLKLNYQWLQAMAAGDHVKKLAVRKEKIHWKARLRREDGKPPSSKQTCRVKFDGKVIVAGDEAAENEIERYETNTDYDSSDEDFDFDPGHGAQVEAEMDEQDESEDDVVDHDRHFSEVEDDEADEDDRHSGEDVEVSHPVFSVDAAEHESMAGEIEHQASANSQEHVDDGYAIMDADETLQPPTVSNDSASLHIADSNRSVTLQGASNESDKVHSETSQGQDGASEIVPETISQQESTAAQGPTTPSLSIDAPADRPAANQSRCRPLTARSVKLSMGHASSSQDYRERSLRDRRDSRPDSQLMEEFMRSQETQQTPVATIEPNDEAARAPAQPETLTSVPPDPSRSVSATPRPTTRDRSLASSEPATKSISQLSEPSLAAIPVAEAASHRDDTTKSPTAEQSTASEAKSQSNQPPSSSQKDRQLMPPPTVKPQRRRDRRESTDSGTSLHSDLSSKSSRTARHQVTRREMKKLRRGSTGGRSSASVSSKGSSRNGTPSHVPNPSRFKLSQEFREFRGKRFEFPSPIPGLQRREVSAKLPFDTDDEEDASGEE